MVFHIENARDVIGALEIYANARETIGVVAQHGPVGGAVIAQRRSHDPAKESRKLLARRRTFVPMLQFKPDAVDGVPHLGRERSPYGARIQPRDFKTVADRGWVCGRKRQKIRNRFLVGFFVSGKKGIGAAGAG